MPHALHNLHMRTGAGRGLDVHARVRGGPLGPPRLEHVRGKRETVERRHRSHHHHGGAEWFLRSWCWCCWAGERGDAVMEVASTTYVEGPDGPVRHWLVKLVSQRWHRLVVNCLFVRRLPPTEPAGEQGRPSSAESCARVVAGPLLWQSCSSSSC
jgi:hypothetical protein